MALNRKRWLHLGITVTIVAVGATAFVLLTANKPELKRTAPPVPVPMVRTATVTVEPLAIPIIGEGTVRPLREIRLVPQVNGKVVYVSPQLVDGGAFGKGDMLVRIDPVDYQLALRLAEARVKDTESALRLAEEEAAVAREEWQLLFENNPDNPPPLVVKEPQLAATRAQLAADRAELQKARLDLERTTLKAPFSGRVAEKSVDIGQYVTAGQAIATLFSTEAAEIVVPMEDANLSWFHVPGFTAGDGPGADARVTATIAGQKRTWFGRVDRAEGKLDERTRLINVIVRIDEPYSSKPPLAVGLYVSVEIQGRELPAAIVIPRSALRENDRVWVVSDDNRLRVRPVEVARALTDRVILVGGLADGEQVVTSQLKVATDGMEVRTAKLKMETPS